MMTGRQRPELKLDNEVRRRINGNQEPLQPARHPAAARQRALLVEKVRKARQEIAQIFRDCEHWNAQVRQPHERPIDPDPDGDLGLLAAFYDRILKNDTQ
jgi:hypothetical protein